MPEQNSYDVSKPHPMVIKFSYSFTLCFLFFFLNILNKVLYLVNCMLWILNFTFIPRWVAQLVQPWVYFPTVTSSNLFKSIRGFIKSFNFNL